MDAVEVKEAGACMEDSRLEAKRRWVLQNGGVAERRRATT